MDFVFKDELVPVFDSTIVSDTYGEDELVFDGAAESVGRFVSTAEDVRPGVFVTRRDGALDCVLPLVRVEDLVDVALSVGITNSSRSIRLL